MIFTEDPETFVADPAKFDDGRVRKFGLYEPPSLAQDEMMAFLSRTMGASSVSIFDYARVCRLFCTDTHNRKPSEAIHVLRLHVEQGSAEERQAGGVAVSGPREGFG